MQVKSGLYGCAQRSRERKHYRYNCDPPHETLVYYNSTSRKEELSAPGESAGSVVRWTLTNKMFLYLVGLLINYLQRTEQREDYQHCNIHQHINHCSWCQTIQVKRRKQVVLFRQDNAWPYIIMITGWRFYNKEWNLIQYSNTDQT